MQILTQHPKAENNTKLRSRCENMQKCSEVKSKLLHSLHCVAKPPSLTQVVQPSNFPCTTLPLDVGVA